MSSQTSQYIFTTCLSLYGFLRAPEPVSWLFGVVLLLSVICIIASVVKRKVVEGNDK